MLRKIKDFLWVLVRPGYWISNYPTCKKLDRFILHHISKGTEPIILNDYYVKLGKRDLWVQNYPHAYGHPRGRKILPSCRTRNLLREYIATWEYKI